MLKRASFIEINFNEWTEYFNTLQINTISIYFVFPFTYIRIYIYLN